MLTWFRKHTKSIIIAVAVLFAGSMFYGLGYTGLKGDGSGGNKSNLLAKVNGKEVDAVRFQEMLNRVAQNVGPNVGPSDRAFIENMALGQAVDFTLMLNEARKRVKVQGKEVDAAIDNIMKQQKIPSKRELDIALKRMGLSLGRFRDLIKDDIMVQKLSMKQQAEIKVMPDDLREIRASHILLTTESEAKQVLEQIKQGGNFAQLAKKHSQDPGSAVNGGDLGYFSAGMMVEPFEKAAFSLKSGGTSGIVKSPFGFHIIKAVDSRLRKFPGAEKDPERAALREKQEKSFRRWYAEVRGKAKIEIINPVFRAHDLRFKGQVQAAIDEYKKAALDNPANPYLHVYLGDAYAMTGRKDLAIPEYENAIKIEGGNPEFYLVIGKAYADAKESDLAAVQYRKASLIAGDNKALHEKLLKLFQGMKRGREAALEQSEIRRIEKKEKFERELQGTSK